MKLIKQYILDKFLKFFLFCLTTFICLSWVIDLFEHLDEIAKANVPLFVLCDYYLSLTPFIFTNISPIIMILSVMFTLGSLNKHNEITAIKAIGINLWSIIWIFLILGFLLSAISFTVNEIVKPNASLHAEELKETYFKTVQKKQKNKIIKNLTFYGSHNRIFIINSYDIKRRKMQNVTISENNAQNQLSRQIAAKQALWIENCWIFYDCVITEYNNGELAKDPQYFAEKVIPIDEQPKDIKRANVKPLFMNYWQLKKYIRRLKANGFDVQKELVIFYNKIAFPLANLLLIFFAVPASLRHTRSSNNLFAITLSIISGFSYWGINAACLSLGKINVLPALAAAWLTNFIFLFVGILMVSRVKK